MTNKEAISILKNAAFLATSTSFQSIEEAIEIAAKALEKQQWIPCSDRMPDQYGNYLVSIEGDEPDIGTINPNDPRGWSLCDANGFYWANDKHLNITAWMPLPEPYREEGEER